MLFDREKQQLNLQQNYKLICTFARVDSLIVHFYTSLHCKGNHNFNIEFIAICVHTMHCYHNSNHWCVVDGACMHAISVVIPVQPHTWVGDYDASKQATDFFYDEQSNTCIKNSTRDKLNEGGYSLKVVVHWLFFLHDIVLLLIIQNDGIVR